MSKGARNTFKDGNSEVNDRVLNNMIPIKALNNSSRIGKGSKQSSSGNVSSIVKIKSTTQKEGIKPPLRPSSAIDFEGMD
jgi:hypothetical protein